MSGCTSRIYECLLPNQFIATMSHAIELIHCFFDMYTATSSNFLIWVFPHFSSLISEVIFYLVAISNYNHVRE